MRKKKRKGWLVKKNGKENKSCLCYDDVLPSLLEPIKVPDKATAGLVTFHTCLSTLIC